MITIRTEQYPSDIGKDHDHTLYQLGESLDFTLDTNILKEVRGDITNNMLNIGIINLIQPENVVWYTRFKRFFTDGTSEENWSNPEPVYGSDLNNNRFIKFDSNISRPSTKASIDNNGIKIEVSEALIDGADGHLYSTYLLFSNGELIFSDVENKEDLVGITIPITTLNHRLYNNITVMVIQGTANGAESPSASIILNNSKLSFSLSGALNNIPYNRGQKYVLTSNSNNVVVTDARVYAGSGDDLGAMNKLVYVNSVDGLTRFSEIFLDSSLLEPSSIYTLKLTAMSIVDNSIVENFDYIITTDDIDSGFIIDRDYEYTTKEVANFTNSTGIVPITNEDNDFTMCYASNYRDILLSSANYPNSVSVFKFLPNNLNIKLDKDINLDILEEAGKKIVFFTRDRKAIIVAAETNDTLKIIKCSYNPYDNTRLIKESTNSFYCSNALNMVEKNAVVLDNKESNLYCLENIEGGSEFYRINLTDMSKEVLKTRQNSNGISTLSILNDDKILSLRGSDELEDFFVYSIKENLWSPYRANYPTDIKYLNCYNAVLRKDGKVSLFPAKNSTAKNFLTLDVEEKKYTEESFDISEDYVMDSIIRQADGSFVLITSNIYDKTDKMICYMY